MAVAGTENGGSCPPEPGVAPRSPSPARGTSSGRPPSEPGGGASAQAYAEAIVETVRQPLLVLDGELHVEAANPAFYDTFDTSPDETRGRPVWSLGNGQWDIPELRKLLTDLVPRDRTVEDYPVEHRFPGLGRRVVLVNAREIRSAGQATGKILLAMEDITEEREAKRELERSNRDLEQFAYVASHDLQEPLRMITGYLELLRRRYAGELDEDADEFIRYAVDGARRMKSMVNDLLAFSRVGRKGVEVGTVSCEEVVETVRRDLSVRLEEEDATLSHGELPALRGDRSQLERLFRNLVENALEHRGEEPPRVHIESRREGSLWRFEVRDNGPGIPAGREGEVFDLFRQLDSERGGTGVGLAICRKIVNWHGGEIAAEPDRDGGAVFSFTLPAAMAPGSPSAAEAADG